MAILCKIKVFYYQILLYNFLKEQFKDLDYMDFCSFKLNQPRRTYGATTRFIVLTAREQCQAGDHFPYSAPARSHTIIQKTLQLQAERARPGYAHGY
jgi:hypothetical protein